MWALGLFVGIIVLVLFVPLRLCLRLKGPGRPAWAAEASWAGWLGVCWGEDGRSIFAGRLRRPLAAKAAGPVQPEPSGERIRQLWQQATGRRRWAMGRFLAAVWRATDFSARGTIIYGFADPALTAWLHGLLCALEPGPTFSAEADFSRVGWDGNLEVVSSLRLYRILWPAARLAAVCWRTRKDEGGEKVWQVQV